MHSSETTHWGHAERSAPAPSGFRAQLARGVHLTWISLRVLVHDPQLMALPFLAFVLSGFVWMVVVLTAWATGFHVDSPSSTLVYQEIFAAYLLTYLIGTYFMAAIIGAATERLRGRRPSEIGR